MTDTQQAALLRDISEQLFTGGYDATEGEEGSRDTTWTDFGIVCGIADALVRERDTLAAALREAQKLADKWEREANDSLAEWGVPTRIAPFAAVSELRAALAALDAGPLPAHYVAAEARAADQPTKGANA